METLTKPAQVEEPAPGPAPEPDAPASDEQPPHFIAPAQAPAPVEGAPALQPKSAYYAICDAARSAGVAPLYAGDPGYRAGLDCD